MNIPIVADTEVGRLLNECLALGIELAVVDGQLDIYSDDDLPASLLARLKQHKSSLLSLLVGSDSETHQPNIALIPRDKPSYPLSSAQQRIWFVDKLENGTSHFNMCSAIEVTGQLDLSCVTQAFNHIIARHEPLHTVFVETEQGLPEQKLLSEFDFALDICDIPCVDDCEFKAKVSQAIAKVQALPFDLQHDLMVRGIFYRQQLSEQATTGTTGTTGTTKGVLLFTLHHIAGDGWSLGVLVDEFVACYQAFIHGQQPKLTPLPLQYIDYASWQQQVVNTDKITAAKDYWTSHLSGAPLVHGLVLDFARNNNVKSPLAALKRVTLCADISHQLQQLAKAQQVTLFMLLHGLLALTLSRHSNSQDIVIGTISANRQQVELEGLIGCFVNTLALRTSTDFDQFESFLAHVKQVNLAAQQHAQFSLEQVADWLQVPSGTAHMRLVQIVFSMDTSEQGRLELPDLTVETWPRHSETGAKFDLEVIAANVDDGINIEFVYNQTLFDGERIERMAGHMVNLAAFVAQSAVVNGHLALKQLPMLGNGEVAQLLTLANLPPQVAVNQFKQGPLLHLLTRQFNHCGHQIALVNDEQQITFTELETRIQQIGVQLLARGIKSGDSVGLAAIDGFEQVAGFFAVLFVGAMVVPMALEHPADRITYMVSDSGMKLLLVDDLCQWQAKMRGGALGCELMLMERYAARLPAGRIDIAISANQPAYMIYTSGSTGLPKGVVISHQSWASYMVSVQDLYQVHSRERVLQFSSPVFDIFIEELSLSLLSGAALVFNTDIALPGSCEFWQFVAEQQIDICSLPTAYWHGLCSDDKLADYLASSPLRLMILGGEALQLGQLQRWQQALKASQSAVELINTYGPTETTVIATAWRAVDLPAGCHHVPIGRPVASSCVFVLDDDDDLTPFGAVGELCIAGPTLALAYHGLNRQTAAAFRQVALGGQVLRVYRSGDLVRYLPDGNLVFVGRKDRQIKVRGYRIEPGEIEQSISQVDGVIDGAVIAKAHHNSWRLLAYFSGDIAIGELQAKLSTRLPDYMLPTEWIKLAQMPLTTNGKVDYRGLETATSVESSADSMSYDGLKAPTNERQVKLAQIWAQQLALDVGSLALDQSFFQSGGDSIAAVRLLAAVNQAFDSDISLKAFFNQPTIEALNALIDESLLDKSQQSVKNKAVLQHKRGQVSAFDAVVASSQQQRIWLLEQLSEQTQGAYNIFHSLGLKGQLQLDKLTQAFADVVQCHEGLRTVFFTDNNQLMQRCQQVDADQLLLFSDLSELCAEQQTLTLTEMSDALSQYRFDLSQDLLLRAHVVKLGQQRYQLMICVHHIVADGWSVSLLVEGLNHCYNRLCQGLLPQLTKPAMSYRDYSLWQAEQLTQHSIQDDLAYWQQQLAGLPLCHDLPLDGIRPVRQSFTGKIWQHRLPVELSNKLKALALEQDVTLFVLLQTIFALLIARFSHSQDIAIGSAVANRPLAQQSDVIGCFINTLVLRSKLDEDIRFSQLLANNKTMIIDGFAHQGLGFETLVEKLAVARNTAFSPLFQIMFVLHNNRRLPLSLDGLTLTQSRQYQSRQYQSRHSGAKYDLTLNVFDLDDGDHDNPLVFDWEFNSDLFDSTTIETMAKCWQVLAEQLVLDVERCVWHIPLTESKPECVDFEPIELTTIGLFSLQVAQRPDAIAIEVDGEGLSYSALAHRVDQLVTLLGAQGIGIGSKVAIKLDHQVNLPVAMLAVMKLGATYVPLDTDISFARQNNVLARADVQLLLTTDSTLLNFDEAVTHHEVSDNCSADLSAYILFTSGSTGEPKGVEISHGALANLLLSMAKRPGFSADDRLLALTPISFDISGLELLLPLICGGTLVMVGDSSAQRLATNSEALADLLQSAAITMMQATPTMWRILLDSHWQGKADLTALCGGEALTLEQGQLLASKTLQLWNMYGPTETTIWSFCGTVSADCQQISIGEPIDNTDFCILDHLFNPVPLGVVGQLYIAGAGLAKGYLHREDLTAKAFVYIDGTRWYATGDLVRQTKQHGLVFMGRVDHQIKLRGFRIEPAEIENCLNLHPSIGDSLVLLASDDGTTRQSLVAYYVLADKHCDDIDTATLRRYLAEHLPAYMIPNLFMVLESFVLTSSGKKDRKALPKPQYQTAQNDTLVAPQNQLEQFISETLQQLLSREQISSQQNFFEMGATSLDLVNLAQKISTHLGRKLAAVELFDKTNVQSLAAYLQSQSDPIQPVPQRSDQRAQGKARLQARLNRRASR